MKQSINPEAKWGLPFKQTLIYGNLLFKFNYWIVVLLAVLRLVAFCGYSRCWIKAKGSYTEPFFNLYPEGEGSKNCHPNHK